MSTNQNNSHFSSARRGALRRFGQLGLGMSALGVTATQLAFAKDANDATKTADGTSCMPNYARHIDAHGAHQQGVITPDHKEAIVIAFNLTVETVQELNELFKIISRRIRFLTVPQDIPVDKDDRLPPMESGILGGKLEPDLLTVTVAVGHTLFDDRFGLQDRKPKHLMEMNRFPNDRLEAKWVGGDLLLQFCANSRESVIYALRDIVRHTERYMSPLWKIDGFLPARDIDRGQTAINLFGFKDGTGNADSKDAALMDDLVWVTAKQEEQAWCRDGSYMAVRLIRFNLQFWDRTPLEDQENDFGRDKRSGAPIGMKGEFDDPEMLKDPHGDRILYDSHIRRAEPRDPERHVAKMRRRSFSYSLGLHPSGLLDMGLIFISFQNDLLHGFIHAQTRLNGEPLERYIKPFGGGYYFVLPGMKDDNTYLGEGLMKD
ncbi:Deferrochelatase/peroxidase EfeB precursor [Oligella ureolytica]|uniref:Deferrochelatase n=1 Tax=Oligella ureolytica TaxID=90244 RepID=A0A378XH08_9BURK|nr:iron uptake transporter deferrochelatase/peroxidase subunit [Oligella ureolytica]QPT39213.1 deferrochelatase/peroxidase EfeB [Oligella ureolytica]SUA55276.1 Deferrochelatase/peroxidase EfeB precursor [Oligella ureolytica]